jgi:hypothetical protein
MAIRPDKDVLNEHAKFTKFDKYRQKPGVMEVADISQQDIDARKMRGFKKYNLETLKELGIVNPTLTEDELEQLKKSKDVEPTGQFKKT